MAGLFISDIFATRNNEIDATSDLYKKIANNKFD